MLEWKTVPGTGVSSCYRHVIVLHATGMSSCYMLQACNCATSYRHVIVLHATGMSSCLRHLIMLHATGMSSCYMLQACNHATCSSHYVEKVEAVMHVFQPSSLLWWSAVALSGPLTLAVVSPTNKASVSCGNAFSWDFYSGTVQ